MGGIGQDEENSIAGGPHFLAHELEPKDTHRSFTSEEIRQELYENRFFLKHRVQRNMRKMRRNPQAQFSSPALDLNDLKPYYVR